MAHDLLLLGIGAAVMGGAVVIALAVYVTRLDWWL